MADISKVINPIGGHILVKPISEEKKTKTGIIIPDTATEEKPQKGVVIALGGGKIDENGKVIQFNIKPKDVVLFKKYSPEEFEYGGENFLILEETDILAVLKE